MPIDFYPDLDQQAVYETDTSKHCLDEIEMFDGPGICMRKKGHRVDDLKSVTDLTAAEFHQEAFEGWIWDNNGSVS